MNTKACVPPPELPSVRLRRTAVGAGEQVQVLLRGVCIAEAWVGQGLAGLSDDALITALSARVSPESVAGWPLAELLVRMVGRLGPIQFEELVQLAGPMEPETRARVEDACHLLEAASRIAWRVDEAGIRVMRPLRRGEHSPSTT
jgi:hypothetical protein